MQASWAWGKAGGSSNSSNAGEADGAFRLPISHRIEENLDRDNLEQASMDREIPANNVGFRLLQKMGWQQGTGLGRQKQGIVDPIRARMSEFRMGLGKQEQDDFYTNEENVQRKKLQVEIEETDELRQKREEEAQRMEKIQTEVQEIRRVFYCELCNKQYKLASEMEMHLSSYDHNHKKRFKESVRSLSEKEKEERQRREKQREEKELQKRAQLLVSQKPSGGGGISKAAPVAAPTAPSAATASAISVNVGGSRGALKFGLGGMKGKPGSNKGLSAKGKGKANIVPSIFGAQDDDEDEE